MGGVPVFSFQPLAKNVSVEEKLFPGKIAALPLPSPTLYTTAFHKDIKAVCVKLGIVKRSLLVTAEPLNH